MGVCIMSAAATVTKTAAWKTSDQGKAPRRPWNRWGLPGAARSMAAEVDADAMHLAHRLQS